MTTRTPISRAALAAALCLALAPALHAAPRMTGFDPPTHSFRFDNSFKNDFVREVDIRTSGLCGGMVYAALDYYNARRPIPEQTYRPAVNTTLHDYIYDRQVTSLVENLDKWAEIGFNPGGARDAEFFRWGLEGTGGGRLQELISEIASGRPVPLGMQSYGGDGPGNHQVLAIGYDLGSYRGDLGAHQEDVKIIVYDPNYPREKRTLVPDPARQGYCYLENRNKIWRTYFVDRKYRAKTPPAIASTPASGDDALVRELVLEFRTGGDDLRGGNDNVDVTIHFADGRTQVARNVNGGRRWIDNYSQTVSIPLATPLPVDKIRRIVVSTTFGGGMGGDNWNLDALTVTARGGGVDRRIYSGSGRPLVRFTGDRKSFTAEAR